MEAIPVLTARSTLRRSHARSTLLCRWLAVALTAAAGAALCSAPAQAEPLAKLDASAASGGPIVVDSAGNGYVTWLHTGSPETVMFCKIPANSGCKKPMTLALPSGSNGEDDGTSQPFPVLAAGNQVWVVAPRYVRGDILFWLSTNGGQSFNPPVDVTAPEDYADNTNVDQILLEPNEPFLGEVPPVAYFDIASSNPGLGFSWLPSNLVAGGTQKTGFQFEGPGSGGVGGATLGEQPDGLPLEAYWLDNEPMEVRFYHQTAGNGTVAQLPQAWTGPTTVGDGYLPQLASGPHGLFLAYESYSRSNTSLVPSVLDVSAYDGSTSTFGPPKAIVTDPQSETSLHNGGTIDENASTGELAVAWPKFAPSGTVMRLWTSSNGSTFKAVGEVANVGFAYAGNAYLALNSKGNGFVTFQDHRGLELADLTPIKKTKKKHH
jgi:hypothetical protein